MAVRWAAHSAESTVAEMVESKVVKKVEWTGSLKVALMAEPRADGWVAHSAGTLVADWAAYWAVLWAAWTAVHLVALLAGQMAERSVVPMAGPTDFETVGYLVAR